MLGVIGLILAIIMVPVGLVVSVVARAKSRRAGYPNRLAVAGIVIGGALTVLTVVGFIVLMLVIAPYLDPFELCEELGPGPHVRDDGVTIECS